MAELSFDTGIAEYKLNGACTVYFNPTDISFIERVFDTFDSMDKKQEEYKGMMEANKDNAAIFSAARKMDSEMREMLNGVFGMDVCSPLFGSMSVYAAAQGLPVWCNLLLAIIDEMDGAFAREKKATNPRVQKYIDKYKKK